MDVPPPECTGHSHDHDAASDDLGLSLRPLIDFDGVICNNEDVPGMGKAVLKLYEDRCTETPKLTTSPVDDDDDDDPELLLHIPFTEAVTVHSIAVRSVGGTTRTTRATTATTATRTRATTTATTTTRDNATPATIPATTTAAPRTLKLFVNRDVLDFETAREAPPEATLVLLPPEHYTEGTIDYPLRPAGRFQNISSLQLFFVDNYSMPLIAPSNQRNRNDSDNDDDNNDNQDRIAATEITYIGLKGQGTKMRRVAVETVYESQGMMKDHKQPGNEYSSGHFVD